VLGLSIPAMIITHGDRACWLGHTLYGARKSSIRRCSFAYWDRVGRRRRHGLMFAVLLISWTHGCIGLYFWLRMAGVLQVRRTISASPQRS